MEAFALFISILSLIVAIAVGAYANAIQTKDSNRETKRFKRDSILFLHEFLNDPEFRNARRKFFAATYSNYDSSTDAQKGFGRLILAKYGTLGRILRNEAIDRDMFIEQWESTFLRDWKRLADFIRSERSNSRVDELFEASVWLAESLGEEL